MALNCVVLVGSVRSDRQGIKAVRYVEKSLAARGHDLTFVDPVEVQLPLLDRMYKEYEKGKAPAVLERLALLYRAADAFIVVSGEYNHSIPPALSNLLDHFLEEYFFARRPSCVIQQAPLAECEQRCSCERYSPSWACRASPACFRSRKFRIRSTVLEHRSTWHSTAVSIPASRPPPKACRQILGKPQETEPQAELNWLS